MGGCLVLLVDDDAAFRGLAARILTTWGHQVLEAGSVAETLELAAERHPGVAVVDVGLADGNGFALTRQLVSPPFSLRVVLISTDSAAGNATASRRAGAQAFVPKDQLLTGDLRRLLDGDGSARPAPDPYDHLAALDPVLAALVARWGRPDPFRWPAVGERLSGSNVAALALHVIGQQISTRAALTIRDRVAAAAGDDLLSAAALARLDLDQLRAAGLSRAKALALTELAHAQIEGRIDLEHMDDLTDDEAFRTLVALRGVGPWTAQVFLISQLHRADVLPSADIGLRVAVQRAWQLPERPTAEEVEARGSAWSPYRSFAAALLWASLEAR